MTNCPVCNVQVKEDMNFCSNCGVQLSEAATERAWIIAMQERIKSVRHNDVIYNLIAVIGVLLAAIIPFVARFVLLYNMDVMSWSIAGAGVILFFGSVIGMWYDNRKVKSLIEELEAGPEYEYEENEDNEEDEK